MTRNASRATRKYPVASTPWFRSHSVNVVSLMGALDAMPAFDTTMSMPPNAETALAKASATARSEVTSPATEIAASPYGATASAAPGPSRSNATTAAPACTSDSRTARPMPPAAPVTSATRPWSSPGGGANDSLYSSSGQYSMAKLSAADNETNSDTALAPAITSIARWYRSREIRAPLSVGATATSPTFWMRTTRGSGSAITS